MSATLYRVNGTTEPIAPQNGRCFNLAEMQKAVGGYVQVIHLDDGRLMLMNEEGKLHGLTFNLNPDVQRLAHKAGIRADDYILGDVIVCESSQLE